MRCALAAFEHLWLLYRRTWRGTLFGSFAQPVLFLVAMGIALGGYVDARQRGDAACRTSCSSRRRCWSTVMQGAAFEGTFPIIGGFHWNRRYHAMFATPLTPDAIAFGQIAWIATRSTMVGADLLLRDPPVRRGGSPGILWAIPIGTLTGLAFAAPIAAYMTTQRDVVSFNSIWRFGITPLFLFSGTFFPIDQLPDAIRWSRGCSRCGTASPSRAARASGRCPRSRSSRSRTS